MNPAAPATHNAIAPSRHPTACHKVEAECCAQVVQASEHKSRQTFTTALEKNRAWP